jgi:hypothetical protein
MKKGLLAYIFSIFWLTLAVGQKKDLTDITVLISKLKQDIRGPYKDIRWFCTDGSIRQPKDPCPDDIGPGWQHASYKDEVVALAKSNHIHLGQILAYTNKEAFWDSENDHARLKQYQLEKYLKSVDDGWILRKGQYYRGAVQAEDEEEWGINFYQWLLTDDKELTKNFFLVRQSLKDIPHSGEDNVAQAMRSQSKALSDDYMPFMELRIKIHGQPEPSDCQKVELFQKQHEGKLTPELKKQLEELLGTMRTFHKPFELASLNKYTSKLSSGALKTQLEHFALKESIVSNSEDLVKDASEFLMKIRKELMEEKNPSRRLHLLDVSLKLEELVFKNAPQWETVDINSLLEKICHLGMASAGAGFIELWEWEQLMGDLSKYETETMTLGELTHTLQRARSQVEWSTGMVNANYADVVESYATFEPLAEGFIDDKIRGSIALHLGLAVGELGNFISKESTLTNQVLDLRNQSTLRGLNPGYALGQLVVVGGTSGDIEVSSDKIYVFLRPPSDLKPVAGIATVAEGNLVSHVQLLARNLGIPNAALSDENLQQLKKYDGQRMFYAVSNKGNVILKPEAQMTSEEHALFAQEQRKEERIEVPVDQIRLNEKSVLNLRNVDAEDSGKLCGPKAANLGQLKKMFPENVVEGLVIPFGIFREHMNQTMPDQEVTYWTFLNGMFKEASRMQSEGIDPEEIEHYQLRQLESLREAIKKMPLDKSFVADLKKGFREILGDELGKVPVFLRSDTNMEDLKDFTGAGLNLTLFNVVDEEKILEGIRAVWASPYTERSFKWRQVYLLNPENVYPSILIIPSVDVDCSGVLITKGIVSNNDNDLTIAFSRGAGGAVDGQAAESYLLNANGQIQLLAPAREKHFIRLPKTGGTYKNSATFESTILNKRNLEDIRSIAQQVQERVARETHSDYDGAWDVELGFKDDKLWLFQIRPFVENKKAVDSSYLESITPKIDLNKKISLSQKL